MGKWEMVKLSQVFDLQMGKTPSRDNTAFWDNGTNKWVSIADLTKSDKYIINTKESISDLAVSSSGIKLVPQNTVIMSFKLSLGKTAITNEDMYTNEAIMAFHNLGQYQTDNNFLFHLFSGFNWGKNTNKAVMGATLNKATLQEIKIPLPPLEIQEQIARNLDLASELVKLHKTKLEELDKLIQSVFYDMFGDPVTNEMGWEVEKLSESIVFLTSGSRGWSKYYSESGEMFLTIKNVKNNRISIKNVQYVIAPSNKEAERTKVQEDDLLISITADLGRTGIVDKDIAKYGAYINQHLSLVRLNLEKVNPVYMSHFLETDGAKNQFQSKNQSAVKAGLTFEAIKSIIVLLPPLDVQQKFTDIVTEIENQKTQVQQALDDTEMLYNSLMQEYFE